jgi:hypothetical protein
LAAERERALLEKEAKIEELENLVREAELRAESIKKEQEMLARETRLLEWEQELHRREREAQKRLAEAEKILSLGVVTPPCIKPEKKPSLGMVISYLYMKAYANRDGTARIGRPGQDRQGRTAGTGLARQDSRDRTGKAGQ